MNNIRSACSNSFRRCIKYFVIVNRSHNFLTKVYRFVLNNLAAKNPFLGQVCNRKHLFTFTPLRLVQSRADHIKGNFRFVYIFDKNRTKPASKTLFT